MEEQFVPYELSKRLEELGFKEKCLATTDQTEYLHIVGTRQPARGSMCYDTIYVPLWQQAFDWFREKHDLYSEFKLDITSVTRPQKYSYRIVTVGKDLKEQPTSLHHYKYLSPNDARIACLEKLIELCQEQKEDTEQKL